MKKPFIPLLLLLIAACDKNANNPEFDYAYRIIRSEYHDDIWYDRLTYYYNHKNQLLRYDKCALVSDCNEYYISYNEDIIQYKDGVYFLNDNNQIIKYSNSNKNIDFGYNNNLLAYEKSWNNNVEYEGTFYFYENNNLKRDSSVIYNSGNPLITVYEYWYTDTLKPDYMVDYSGLQEFPSTSVHLLKEARMLNSEITYKYSYEITYNKLIEYCHFIDSSNTSNNSVYTTVYTYEGN